MLCAACVRGGHAQAFICPTSYIWSAGGRGWQQCYPRCCPVRPMLREADCCPAIRAFWAGTEMTLRMTMRSFPNSFATALGSQHATDIAQSAIHSGLSGFSTVRSEPELSVLPTNPVEPSRLELSRTASRLPSRHARCSCCLAYPKPNYPGHAFTMLYGDAAYRARLGT